MAYTLQILHASDFEAGLGAIEDAPRFAAIVDRLEDLQTNSITLASGDNYIPSPFFNASSDPLLDPFFEESIGRADIRILNTIGVEASVIGNHEFDAGPRDVQNLIRPVGPGADGGGAYEGTQFAYLAANLDFSGEPDLAPNAQTTALTEAEFGVGASGGKRIAPSMILEENGELIGVVGVTTPVFEDITTPGGVRIVGPRTLETDADFAALAATIQPAIDALLAQGINKIVIVSQLQELVNEQRLIPFLKGVDVVIGGGSNTLLSDDTDVLRPGDVSEGEYGQIINNLDGDPTVLVNTDGNYKYVGRLVVEFDDNGVVIPASIDDAVSGAYATDDAGVARVYDGTGIDPFAEGSKGDTVRDITTVIDGIITQKDGVQFGSTDVYLDGRRGEVRSQETNLGNLSADANLWYAKESYDDTVIVSIKNGGGIRDSIGSIGSDGAGDELPPVANPDVGKEAGEVSQLDIENSLRFNNALSLVTLTPEQLLEALENGVSNPGGIFAQVGGLKFSYDLTQPAGSRVQSVALVDAEGRVLNIVVANGEVVDGAPDAIRVVTLSFLIGTANAGAPGGFNRPDGFRFAEYINADPAFANRIDLDPDASGADDVGDRTGVATFTDNGREQDALAEYLADNFSTTPYSDADTDASGDKRIQNLVANGDSDTVFDSIDVNGNDGDNVLDGTAGNELVIGRGGNDTLIGNGGNDIMIGGAGNDTYVTDGGDSIAETANAGTDTVRSSAVTYTLTANVENLTLTGASAANGAGNGLANILNGNNAANYLYGLDGHDRLNAGGGNDIVVGGNGNDVVYGGAGKDNLAGSAGVDYFDFKATSESVVGANRDVLADFSHTQGDKINLVQIDADTGVAGNQAFTFIGSAEFTAAGQVRYANGVVQVNVDGTLGADMEIQVTNAPALTAGDFVL